MQMETASAKTSSAVVRRENRGARRKSVKVKVKKRPRKSNRGRIPPGSAITKARRPKSARPALVFCQLKLLNLVTSHMDIFERIVYCNYRYAKSEIT
jgi:hypothetical protein